MTAVFVAGNPATPWDYKPNELTLAVQDEAGKPLEVFEHGVSRVGTLGRARGYGNGDDGRAGDRGVCGAGGIETGGGIEAMVAKSQFPLTQGDILRRVAKEGEAKVILPASDFTLAGRGSSGTCGCGR